jgi:hypothetical protein
LREGIVSDGEIAIAKLSDRFLQAPEIDHQHLFGRPVAARTGQFLHFFHFCSCACCGSGGDNNDDRKNKSQNKPEDPTFLDRLKRQWELANPVERRGFYGWLKNREHIRDDDNDDDPKALILEELTNWLAFLDKTELSVLSECFQSRFEDDGHVSLLDEMAKRLRELVCLATEAPYNDEEAARIRRTKRELRERRHRLMHHTP